MTRKCMSLLLLLLLFQVLYSVSVRRGSEDSLWWVSSKKVLFKFGSFFSSLACSVGSHFPWKNVWRTQAPMRVTFFLRGRRL
jgi:hypothetical protein